MNELTWVFALAAWFGMAFVLGVVQGRRGHEAYLWTAMGVAIGPIAVALAVRSAFRPPSREPRLIRAGTPRHGTIDVLVGVDGSPESDAAISRVAELLSSSAGRITLARVIALDATVAAEQAASALLADAAAAHPTLDPSTVVLRGEPVAALRDYMTRLGYEVLVLGTRGQGRSKALGSVAIEFARGAGISVLLVDDAPVGAATERPSPLVTRGTSSSA